MAPHPVILREMRLVEFSDLCKFENATSKLTSCIAINLDHLKSKKKTLILYLNKLIG